jgi:transposase-like protein
MAGDDPRSPADAAAEPAPAAVGDSAPRVRRPAPSRDELVAAFADTGGSVRAMARHFGRDRRQIYRWLDAHGLRRGPGER